ncbi:hypothetical protein LTR24_008452 [Lithohypha guttulata]|uniref:Uncharacterized protein n=1 Tax=Lithohypha guttulata TaxID=1690604 RepID=A0ABR0JZX3_9EURO|nr:hypothetical protein LTR24_008452 [Lithohypha guttulata]
MQQVSHGSSQTPQHLQLISARTLFAARPTGPPSSPPPTSPLPPLPETASHGEERALTSFSEALGGGHPARPPRPTTSLPNLKPRTITSPEIYRRQRNTELAAQVKFSPSQQSCPVESPSKQLPQKTPEHRNAIRLLTPTPQSSSTFSEDVLSAFPKLFQRSPRHCLNTTVGSPLGTANGTDRLKAWQVYHKLPTKSSSRSKKRKTDTKKPIARTALFIPRTPPDQPDRIGIHYPPNHGPLSGTSQSCYEAQSRNTSFGTLSPQREPSKSAPTGSPSKSPPSPSHKRTQAVTAFAFDFGKYYGSPPSVSHGSSTDNLTSLPKLPSSSDVHFPVLGHGFSAKGYPCPHVISESEKRASEEAIAFASIPYAHTIHNACPQPKTEPDLLNANSVSQPLPCPQAPERHPHPPRSSSRRMNRRPTDLETGVEEEEEEEEEEEIKKAKRKRLLWIIATISLVLTATVGILSGIISRLTNLAHTNAS